MTKKASERLESLRHTLGGVANTLSQARDRLGHAIFDEDRRKADELRAQVGDLEGRRSELLSAIAVAEVRAAEELETEARALRRQQAEQANAQRQVRLAAARGVDEALRQLGKAYEHLEATSPGVEEFLVGQRIRFNLRAAAAHWVSPFLRKAGLEEWIPSHHRAPLAELEAATIPEQEIEP